MQDIKLKFMSLDQAAIFNGTSKKRIRMHAYKQSKLNLFRFQKICGNLYVASAYKNVLYDFVTEKYNEAMLYSHSEAYLIKELASISNIQENTIRKNLYRFTFVQVQKAMEYIILFQRFIDLVKKNQLLIENALKFVKDTNSLANDLSIQTQENTNTLKQALQRRKTNITLYTLQIYLEMYLQIQKIHQRGV